MVVDENLKRINKQIAGLASADQISKMAGRSFAARPIVSPAAWTGIKAIEQQWLLQHKLDVMPSKNVIAQSLSQVPEIKLPVLQTPEWLDGLMEVSRSAGSYLTQINSMVERVADALAAPLAGIERIGEELTRPIRGWQQLVDSLPNFRKFEGFGRTSSQP